MKHILFSFVLVFSSLTLADQKKNADESPVVGMGNPASINCYKLGGETEEVQGQVFCNISEWKLYHQMTDRKITTKEKSKNSKNSNLPSGANPASVNCIQIGGESKTQKDENGELAICSVEEWKLFHIINVLD